MFCKVYREIGIGPGIPYVLDRSKPGEKLPDDPQNTDVIKTPQVNDTQRRVDVNGPFFQWKCGRWTTNPGDTKNSLDKWKTLFDLKKQDV